MDETLKQPSATGTDPPNPSARAFDLPAGGKGTSLICLNEGPARNRLLETLTGMGYQVSLPASSEEVLRGMRFHVYDLVIVDENFATADQTQNQILAYLESLPMSTRRRMFVAMVSSRFQTNDSLAAFNHSVNIVINPQNIDETDRILRTAIQENNSFYHVFKETMAKLGRI